VNTQLTRQLLEQSWRAQNHNAIQLPVHDGDLYPYEGAPPEYNTPVRQVSNEQHHFTIPSTPVLF
jgi:hypothetical protein